MQIFRKSNKNITGMIIIICRSISLIRGCSDTIPHLQKNPQNFHWQKISKTIYVTVNRLKWRELDSVAGHETSNHSIQRKNRILF